MSSSFGSIAYGVTQQISRSSWPGKMEASGLKKSNLFLYLLVARRHVDTIPVLLTFFFLINKGDFFRVLWSFKGKAAFSTAGL